MNSRDNLFVVTKPLQLIVALSIIEQLEIASTSTVIIVNYFHDSHSVFERLQQIKWYFSDVTFLLEPDNPSAYRRVAQIRPNKLYVDGDVGVRRHIKFLQLKLYNLALRINVYEEGMGTYRTDIYSGLKKAILSAIGVATFFGGGLLTNKIYVSDPERYCSKFPDFPKNKVMKLEAEPRNFVSRHFLALKNVFNYHRTGQPQHDICNVYITSWEIDYDFIIRFNKLDGDKFVKPHPHILDFERPIIGNTIERSVPAELVFIDLANRYQRLNIFHHGSSVEMYLDAPNIEFFLV